MPTRVLGLTWPDRSYAPGNADTFSVSGLQADLAAIDAAATWVTDAEPDAPLPGDRWVQPSTGSLSIYSGGQWHVVSGTQTLNFILDGGGLTIMPGPKGHLQVDFPCVIESVTLLADQVGSIVIDVWKDTLANFPPTVADSITASAKPTLASAQKAQDATLTGWQVNIAAGDVLAFTVVSAATVQRVTLALKVRRA